VLKKYSASENTAASEVGDVVEIHRLAERFPESQRDEIQELATSCARVVVDEEWLLMKDGQTNLRAEALAYDLGRSIQDFEPNTESEKAVYAQSLGPFN
jgi:hypothetical protein